MTVLYPGSFDPIHRGHVDIVEQAAALFGEVVVAVMHNPAKPSGSFTITERVELAAGALGHVPSVRVEAHEGLAVDAARRTQARFIVKGLRVAGDFEIEQQMAQTNFAVAGVHTVYLPCRAELSFISSRFIREIAAHGGDIDSMVPEVVASRLNALAGGRSSSSPDVQGQR
jgi:pantetheine-phosphate adenylyltransferase